MNSIEERIRVRFAELSGRRVWFVLVLGLLFAACGSATEVPVAAGGEADVAEESTTETTVVEETTESVEQDAVDAEPAEEEAADEAEVELQNGVEVILDAGTNEVEIWDGIQFELLDGTPGTVAGGCFTIRVANYQGSSPFPPGVYLATVELSGRFETAPVSTVDDWLALYGDMPRPEATGETITILGQELDGYRVAGPFSDGPPGDDEWLNCASNSNALSDLVFLPSPHADVFVAETPDGLMMAAADAFTEEEAADARVLLDQIVGSIEAS